MSYSRSSLKEGYKEDHIVEYSIVELIKVDIRSLDCSSYNHNIRRCYLAFTERGQYPSLLRGYSLSQRNLQVRPSIFCL